jgi:imidazolonepropionase-like amidohydrolase
MVNPVDKDGKTPERQGEESLSGLGGWRLSSPPSPDIAPQFGKACAALAQLVEHIIRNDGVTCSSHVSGTICLAPLDSQRDPAQTRAIQGELIMKYVLLAVSLLMSSAAYADVMLLQAGRVITDPTKPALGASTIAVRDGKILSINSGKLSTTPDVQPNEKITIVDLGSRTLMPGLIDLHVHLTGDPGTPWYMESVFTDEYQTLIGAKNAAITLHAGFTTVRDVGSSTDSGFALRDAIKNGVIEGPRVQSSGPAISITGGHGDVSGFRREVLNALGAGNTCSGADACAERVREASRAGADVIKITATGGVLSQQSRGLDKHFTDAELKAIMDTAKTLGLKVAAHAHGPRGIEAAAKAGVTTIEHGTFADEAAMKAMKDNGTVMVATLMALTGLQDRVGKNIYTPVVEAKAKVTLEQWGKALNKMYKMGVPIAFGTDSGVFEHGRNAGEFALMLEKSGISARDALTSATLWAAKAMGLEHEIGTLDVGKSADMIAVEDDPLGNIRTLEKPAFVMARGKIAVQPSTHHGR